MNIESPGADMNIQLCLAEKGKKLFINKSQMVYIVRGLIHGPLIFKTVNAPIMLIDIVFGA
jgi:hypothetical protein